MFAVVYTLEFILSSDYWNLYFHECRYPRMENYSSVFTRIKILYYTNTHKHYFSSMISIGYYTI